MIRGLFEGWHPIILLLAVVILFGGKRLPDAARGLGRSLRIFKSEVKQMQEEDKPRPAATPSVPEPLEGKIVSNDPGRAHSVPEPSPAQGTSEPRRDA